MVRMVMRKMGKRVGKAVLLEVEEEGRERTSGWR